MRRATTPTHIFTLPSSVDVADLVSVLITYSQDGRTILEKKLEDIEIDTATNSISIELSQDETRLFAPGKALVQLRAKTDNDSTLASQMIWLPVKPALNSEDL